MPQQDTASMKEEYLSKEWYDKLDHLYDLCLALKEQIEDMEGWERVWESEIKLFGVIPIGKKIKRQRYRPKRD